MLDTLIPTSLPYPIRGAIIRAVRTAVAILLGGLSASIADGTIIAQFHFIPAAYTPVVILALSTSFVAIDKYLREKGLVDEATAAHGNVPLTDPTPTASNDTEEPAATIETQASTTDSTTSDGEIFDDVDPTIFDDPTDGARITTDKV